MNLVRYIARAIWHPALRMLCGTALAPLVVFAAHAADDPLTLDTTIERALREAPSPGGVAHLSVYSEAARSEVVRLRAMHPDRMGIASDDEVREFRWHLMLEDPAAIDGRRRLSSILFS